MTLDGFHHSLGCSHVCNRTFMYFVRYLYVLYVHTTKRALRKGKELGDKFSTSLPHAKKKPTGIYSSSTQNPFHCAEVGMVKYSFFFSFFFFLEVLPGWHHPVLILHLVMVCTCTLHAQRAF